MKQRDSASQKTVKSAEDHLCEAFARLDEASDIRSFLRDLCTPAELEAMIDRWQVVPLLLDGLSYRQIHAQTQVSLTTVGRVARFLKDGHGGYAKAAQALATPMQHD